MALYTDAITLEYLNNINKQCRFMPSSLVVSQEIKMELNLAL